MAGVFPVLYIVLPMVAGVLMMIMAAEINTYWALLTYTATGLMALFITFNKESALLFILIFGHYPIIKPYIEKMKSKLLQYTVKFFVYNACIMIFYSIVTYLLGIGDMAKEFGALGRYAIFGVWAVTNFIFLAYDKLLTRCISMYLKWFKPKILGKH